VEDVLEVRPAQLGDTAVFDFDGFVDGKPLENGSGRDQQLELG
jgi:trigger factor